MRNRSTDSRPRIAIVFEGNAVETLEGVSVACALLAAGAGWFRNTPVSGAKRAPYCMMGICFDCLVEIDGVANRQACMVTVRDGMRINRQRGARRLD